MVEGGSELGLLGYLLSNAQDSGLIDLNAMLTIVNQRQSALKVQSPIHLGVVVNCVGWLLTSRHYLYLIFMVSGLM